MWPRTPLNIEYGAPCPPPRHAMGLCKRNSLFPALTTCRSFLHAKSLPSIPPHLLSVFSFETDSLSETRTRRGIGFGLTEPPSFDHQPSLSLSLSLVWMAWLGFIFGTKFTFFSSFLFLLLTILEFESSDFSFFLLKVEMISMIRVKLSN